MGIKVEDLVTKLIKYIEKFNLIEFRPYQITAARKITTSLILNEGICMTSLWARKSGKSKLLKCLFAGMMALLPQIAKSNLAIDFPTLKRFREGFVAIVCGPKMDTSSMPFNEIRQQAKTKYFRDCLDELDLEISISNSKHFELSNGSKAMALSGSETASNEGAGADLLCIDEASMLSAFSVYKILKPFTAETNGTISETGTPWRRKCAFLTDIGFNKRYHPDRHVEIPYTEVMKYSPSYANYIENQLLSLPGGLDNVFFRMNFLLEWLITENNFVDPIEFQKLATSVMGEYNNESRLYAGIDWGKVNSETCVTILSYDQRMAKIIDLLNLSGRYSEQIDIIIPFLHKYNLSAIIPESNNIGDPLSEQIEAEFGRIVHPQFMSMPLQDKIFTNLSMFITANPPRFAWYDDNSRESRYFSQQFLDAEQEMRGPFLSVHKPNEEGSKDDFLFSTGLALDGALSDKFVKPTFNYKSSGKHRGVFNVLKDY